MDRALGGHPGRPAPAPMNLFIAPAVAEAIKSKQPVVALESTVITHGLPFPDNRTTALAMEAAVRAANMMTSRPCSATLDDMAVAASAVSITTSLTV